MARTEKTVFISYRRTDVYTALAVYENLKNQGYDVFFDYRSISSGDFEQIITSNIRARAHFLLILTPTALDRCNEPGDWLRREIEFAIDERRNIIPLFFRGFRFGDPSVTEKLTGKLWSVSRYNGLNVHEDYFDEAMHRLRTQYLNVPLNTVLHPVSTEVRKVVRQEQIAADKALEQIEDVRELVKQANQETNQPEVKLHTKPEIKTPRHRVDAPAYLQGTEPKLSRNGTKSKDINELFGIPLNFRYFGLAIGIFIGLLVLSISIRSFLQNLSITPVPTSITPSQTFAARPSQTSIITFTPTKTLTATLSVPIQYTIQEGDSLESIAQKFNLGNDGALIIYYANQQRMEESGGVIFVGQTITIPPPGSVLPTTTPIPADLPRGRLIEYRVLPGDTLAGIAAKFNSIPNNIMQANNLENPNALTVGQILQIPVNLVTPTATLPPTSTPVPLTPTATPVQ